MSRASALCLLLSALSAAEAPVGDLTFEQVTASVSAEGREQSVQRMEAWLKTHPADPNAGRGVIWMAQLRIADGRFEEARPYFERARAGYPGTEWELQGIKGIADLDRLARSYGAALAGYQHLAELPSPLWNYMGRMGVAQTRSERSRYWTFLGLVFGLGLLTTVRLRWARRAGDRLFWPLPEEMTYALPVVLLMIIAAIPQPSDEGRGVITVAVGGLLLLWVNGIYLRACPPRRWARLREATLGIAQAAALLFCAVVANGLWEKFHDTLVMGAE